MGVHPLLGHGDVGQYHVGGLETQQAIDVHLFLLRLAMKPADQLTIVETGPQDILRTGVSSAAVTDTGVLTRTMRMFAQSRLRPVRPTLEMRRTSGLFDFRN